MARCEEVGFGGSIDKKVTIYVYIYNIFKKCMVSPPQLSTFLGVVEREIEGFRGQMPTCVGYFLVFASFNLCTKQPFPVFFYLS